MSLQRISYGIHGRGNLIEQNEAFPKLVTELPSMENGGISADGKTITMTLRSDVVWSDKTPLTSADFKFTYEMAINPANAVSSAYPYDKIESMDTPDDQTVVIHFIDPFAPWLAYYVAWHPTRSYFATGI